MKISSLDLPALEILQTLGHSCLCNVCNQPFASVEDLKEHIVSQVLGVFVCCKCGSKFVDEKTFRLHLREHKKVKYVANYKAGSNSGKLIDSRVNDVFICKYCDAPFQDRGDFYNHYMTHMGKCENMKRASRSCIINEIHSKATSSLDSNQEIKVETLYECINYKCIKCQEGFFKSDKAVAHSRKCRGNLRCCDLCPIVLENNTMLFEHYETVHTKLRKMCRFCFNTFLNEDQLQQHITKAHLKYPYFCHKCKGGFSTLSKFTDHMKTKHGMFYSCKKCHKEFPSTSTLNIHLKSHTKRGSC